MLEQSYRIPAEVHGDARIQPNSKQVSKEVSAPKRNRQSPTHYSISEIDMSEGLAHNGANELLSRGNALKYDGYLFERSNRSISEKISTAVNGWERLRKERNWCNTARAIYDCMTNNGACTRLQTFGEHIKTSPLIANPQLQYGLGADDTAVWHEAMDKLPVDQILHRCCAGRKV